MSCPSMGVDFWVDGGFGAGSRSPPWDDVPLSCWIPADLVSAQWRQSALFPSVSEETCQKGGNEDAHRAETLSRRWKESKMSSSQAGLWTDGNSSVWGMARLRYYTTRDRRKRALPALSRTSIHL